MAARRPSFARELARLAVEHVAPAVVHQLGEALREHLARRRTPDPKPATDSAKPA